MRKSIHNLVPYQHIFNKYRTSETRTVLPYFMKSILNLKSTAKDSSPPPRFKANNPQGSNLATLPILNNKRFEK